ncbi:hypothetical protein [Nonomuraea dietziae]|uniref:hypothetical protein n=1 Tax=Nonomuraea dietziae TaxID=65515 RepID=UPI0033DE1A29
MRNTSVSNVVPLDRHDHGTFKAKDGSTIQVVQVRDRIKLKITTLVMGNDGYQEESWILDFDTDTALPLQVALGLAAIGATGHDLIDTPKSV